MSTNFSIGRNQLIEASLRLMGVLAEGEVPTAKMISDGVEALNILLKQWADKGYKGWIYRVLTWPPVASAASFTIGPTGDVAPTRPQRIASAWTQYNTSGERQEVVLMQREDFFRLSPSVQLSPAPCTNIYYDPQITNAVVHVWPAWNGTGLPWTLHMNVQAPMEDLAGALDPVVLPQTWFAAAKWGLADEMALEYRVHPDVMDRLERRAPIYLAACANLEEEQGSIVFKPSMESFAYGQEG